MLQIYHEYSGNPGYRMMRVYLLRAKISLSNTTVLKYMQELGIKSHKRELKQAILVKLLYGTRYSGFFGTVFFLTNNMNTFYL